jgi:protein phosphatase
VPRRAQYYEPAKPFLPRAQAPASTAQQQHDDLLDLDDVLGKRIASRRAVDPAALMPSLSHQP